MCVESGDYYLIVNNKLVGHIIRGRGLLEGDHYLFIYLLCVKGL